MSDECTCQHDMTEDYDVIVVMCDQHAHIASMADDKVRQVLDDELDQSIREACGGKRAKRIWRVDP